jgi:hypothetical protein
MVAVPVGGMDSLSAYVFYIFLYDSAAKINPVVKRIG